MLAPAPILSLEGRKELAGSLWTRLAQGWSFMCTISWQMLILLEKAIACPIFGHPSPCPVLAGAFVTCSAPRGQREDGASSYPGGRAAAVPARLGTGSRSSAGLGEQLWVPQAWGSPVSW